MKIIYTLHLLILFILAQDHKIFKSEDRKVSNKLFIQEQKSDKQNSTILNQPEVIQLNSPNTFLIKIQEGEYYLKKIEPKTNQSIMFNLNEVHTIDFKDKKLTINPSNTKVDQLSQQKFPIYEWTPVISLEEFPKNRGGHSMHIVGETILIWGGCYLDIICFNDLYLFNTRSKKWSYPKQFGDPPSPRTGHSSFINGAKIYIFGGSTLTGLQSDFFSFDLESRSWNQLFWEGISPEPRSNHKMVLTNKGIAVLFGGYIGEGYSNDIYIADLANEKWGKPVVSGIKPLPRESFGMIFHRNSVWVIGGYATGIVLNDIFVLTTEEFVWEPLDMFGTLPKARQGISIAKFDHRLYLIGGCNPKIQECYNDIHILDTNTMHSSLINPFAENVLRASEYGSIGFMGPVLYHFGGCYLMNICTNDFLALRIDEKCPNECNHQGTCRNQICHCHTGWQEVDCSVPVVCKLNCLAQGICLTSGQCQCYPGYSGSSCQIYIPCPNNCTDIEHGRCMNDGSCLCTKKYQGETCELDIKMIPFDVQCPQNCLGQGICNKETGLCVCNPGFGGPDCSLVEQDELDENMDLLDAIQNEQDDEQDLEDEGQETENLQPAVGVSVQGLMKSINNENGFHSLFNADEPQEEDESLERIDQFGYNLLGRSRKKNEEEFEIMDLSQCQSKCKKHGICINNKCFCRQGYTGERCQASKVRDLVIGYRYRNLYIFSVISFILGILVGFGLIKLHKKSQAQNEFKSVGSASRDSEIMNQVDEEDKQQIGTEEL